MFKTSELTLRVSAINIYATWTQRDILRACCVLQTYATYELRLERMPTIFYSQPYAAVERYGERVVY